MYRLFWIAFAFCYCCNSLLAKEILTTGHIYVDVKAGNDANPGSLNEPLKSLRTAQEHARRLYQQQPQDVTILLRAGQHNLTSTWSFAPLIQPMVSTTLRTQLMEKSR